MEEPQGGFLRRRSPTGSLTAILAATGAGKSSRLLVPVCEPNKTRGLQMLSVATRPEELGWVPRVPFRADLQPDP